MERLFAFSPLSTFALYWVAFITLALIGSSVPLIAVQLAIGFALLIGASVGYPLLVIFALSPSIATGPIRGAALMGVAAMVLNASANFALTDPTSSVAVAIGVLGAAGWLTVISVSTAAIGNARRHRNSYKPLDALSTWIGLISFPFVGVFFVHRSVAALVQTFAAESKAAAEPTSGTERPEQGSPT